MRNLRTSIALAALLCCAIPCSTSAQGLQTVVVEKYYISDANDATDTDGGFLQEGSVTYRVFLDMGEGYKLRSLFGDSLHPFTISSTAVLFNNGDRGKRFGHLIQDQYLGDNTVALDSWLSLGDASEAHIGVLEGDDTDGSVVGGSNNDGGSASVPGGLLVNSASDAGLPLTDRDGLLPGTGMPPGFLFIGDAQYLDSAFFEMNQLNAYTTMNMVSQAPAGVVGYGAENRILIAQITTAGELSFALNVELLDSLGNVLRYVANDDTLLANETAFGLLNYPPECGCMDPNYLEYDPTAGCDDGSCATAIVFGCSDTTACNFDPNANFNIDALCCYGPGDCNGLDINIVCPGVGLDEAVGDASVLAAWPNPAHGDLMVQWPFGAEAGELRLLDATGRTIRIEAVQPGRTMVLDLSELAQGSYVLLARSEGTERALRLVKQ
ncbi:MAG: T9SS type A sorting domain-containing protein [Flavobacteriales bacterium]|nr:MAG: T9SS type A sorting domain-containing protein [Flavobacteriales bacterium]